MPIFKGQRPQPKGRVGFVYDISADDVTEVASEILSAAEAPFMFQGKVGDRREPLENPRYVATTLSRGGAVAACVPFSGTSVNVFFNGPNEMLVIPFDGDRFTAEALIGTAPAAGNLEPGDDFDPFADEFDNVPDFPTPVADPRARSMELTDRYSMEDDMANDAGYPHSQPAGTNDGGPIPVKPGEWFVTLLLLIIPVVNIIATIIWLVSKKTNPNKKNFLVGMITLWVISALFLGAATYAVTSSGILEQLFPQATQSQQPYESSSNSSYGSYGSYANEEDGGDEGYDSGYGNTSASNLTSNLTGNVEGEEGAGEQDAGGEVDTGMVTVNNVARTIGPDDRSIAIVTLTTKNNLDRDLTPQDLLDITGYQGQNVLERNTDPQESFIPVTFDTPIEPGGQGTFQVSFFLVDDQDLNLRVTDKDTGNVVLDVKRPLS